MSRWRWRFNIRQTWPECPAKVLLTDPIAAISCGIHEGTPVLDLDYIEDSAADTDANFVITGKGGIVEIQGTAEKDPFSQEGIFDFEVLN